MSRVALVVTAEFEPEHREEILRSLLAHRERCLRDEPGTLQFEVLAPADEPGKLMLFEVYTDADALTAHAQGASIGQYRLEARPKITKMTSHRCQFGQEPSV